MHKVIRDIVLTNTSSEQKSEEWLAERKKRLTASDGAASIGIKSNGTTQKDLLFRKCGLKEFNGNIATRHGERYEDVAREIYEQRYNTKVYETGLCIHPEHKWLGGSPDGITIDGILIEIKCHLI